jgi:hypothetical protein
MNKDNKSTELDNTDKKLNLSDVSKNDWLKDWKVIDLLEVIKEISGGDHNHPVQREWEYQIQKRSKGNDRGNLEWVGDNEKTPLINEFLLSRGFEKDEKVIYWICW